MAQDEPSGEVPAKVDASGGQGVQVGTGNVQHLHVHSATPRRDHELDVVALGALSPHAAAAQIRRMRHDDAVVLLASVSPDDVADLLGALLEADEAMTVSLLADINPRKAKALIARLAVDAPWLESLPKAAKAIARRAVEMKWDQSWESLGLERVAQSADGAEGYFRENERGMIYWSDRGGACAISGVIADYHAASGGTGGEFGFPLSEQMPMVASPFGTEGTGQAFERGFIYSSAHGTYGVSGTIFSKYYSLSASGGWLGFPTSKVASEGEGWGLGQSFEGGTVWVVRGQRDPVAVPATTMEMLTRDAMRALGPPLSDEASVGSGDGERIQFFRNGIVSLRDGKREVWWRWDSAAGNLANADNEYEEVAGDSALYADLTGQLSPGARFAGYRVEEFIGSGGKSAVYRAYDESVGREVALKLFVASLTGDAGFGRGFQREARAAAKVEHPHIIPVYEAGQERGVPFIAMRLVRGGDLRSIVTREGSMTPGRAGRFVSAVASALDAAHEVGVVHRDVKPGNMLVDSDRGSEHVYLSDFGLAWSLGQREQTLENPVGTPEYVAPEQITGGNVDGRADQYALGCVAYFLLTGSVPFPRDEALAALYAHLYDPPPPVTAMRPDLPGAVNQVLARAMEKRPDRRYETCAAFAGALLEALGMTP
jgi:Protein kinase domain